MTMLLISVGALFLAVIGYGILAPWPSSDPAATDAEGHVPTMMEAIALSIFSRHIQLLALLVEHGKLNISAAASLLGLSGPSTSLIANRLVDLRYAIRKVDNDRPAHRS